jgi:hypothetical protein
MQADIKAYTGNQTRANFMIQANAADPICTTWTTIEESLVLVHLLIQRTWIA